MAKQAFLLRLDLEHPMVQELVEEARLRAVSLQQHIYDLLQSRYLARHGQSISDLLWVPSEPRMHATDEGQEQQPGARPLTQESPEQHDLPASSASAAGMWMNMMGDEEE